MHLNFSSRLDIFCQEWRICSRARWPQVIFNLYDIVTVISVCDCGLVTGQRGGGAGIRMPVPAAVSGRGEVRRVKPICDIKLDLMKLFYFYIEIRGELT